MALDWVYFLPPLVLTIAASAYLIAKIFHELNTGSERAMALFHLKPEKAKKDFLILATATLTMLLGFALALTGNLSKINLLVSIGRAIWLVAGLQAFYLVFRWWRRFQ